MYTPHGVCVGNIKYVLKIRSKMYISIVKYASYMEIVIDLLWNVKVC